MFYLKFGVLLSLFWLLLSGHTSALLLTLGLASVLLVLWLLRRMDEQDRAPVLMVFNLEFVRYWGWLAWQVVISNIDVVRHIWRPKISIKPGWQRIGLRLEKPFTQTLYANSITLTPGTVTTEVGEGYFVIHALDGEAIRELNHGEMEQRLMCLEGASHTDDARSSGEKTS